MHLLVNALYVIGPIHYQLTTIVFAGFRWQKRAKIWSSVESAHFPAWKAQ